jgi:hypothetical protein
MEAVARAMERACSVTSSTAKSWTRSTVSAISR